MKVFGELFQSADWKQEKHTPVIDGPDSVKKGEFTHFSVSVGKEIPHPNTTEHHIRWIEIYFLPEGAKFPFQVARFDYTAHGESIEGANQGPVYTSPYSCFTVKLEKPGVFYASSYCNIHGLWKSEKPISLND
ncbi:MAG: class II SORL domain-containing protein [Candidatus Atribacteria bacterium]|nr:class II SORL domain-containing protein [Candidatus Atribacteria bacterium]